MSVRCSSWRWTSLHLPRKPRTAARMLHANLYFAVMYVTSSILAIRPVRHRPQGPCSQGAPNTKAAIQCSHSLPTLNDSCPTFNTICQGWPTSQSETKSHISQVVLPPRATSYTWAHMNITPSLPYSNTYFAQLDLLQILHINMTMTELNKPFIVMHVI